ncbi:beta-propeller fold lactonase family protein [Streptomyces rubradiris]|uniref:beta-propeller fold lactonase family protein n=1 Tax=Streptomyces rubradiris TaxID=285531 RepID=UPI00340560C1
MSPFRNPPAESRQALPRTPRRAARTTLAASAVVALSAALGLVPSSAVGATAADTAASTIAGAAPGRFMLVGSTGTGHISSFGVARDGKLTKAGSPYAADAGFSIVVTPDGKKAYVGSLSKKTIKGYSIGSDGSLTPIAGAVAQYDAAVIGLAFSPDGKKLFATVGGQDSGTIRALSVSSSGTLTPLGAPLTIAGKSFLSQPVVTPDGRYVFASSFSANTVTAYAIGSGGLTQVGQPVDAGKGPAIPGITPDGRFLYLTNEQGNTVTGFAVEEDGSLSPTPGSPYPTGNLPHGIAVTPDSKRLYFPEAGSGKVDGFQIADDGELTPLANVPVAAPANTMPGLVLLSPDAKRLFLVDVLTTNLTSKVHSYNVAGDGGLAPTGLPSVDSGALFSDGPNTVMTPDQGPAAKVSTVYSSGLTGVFTASGSTDPDGSVSEYRWNFGDGTTTTTTTPEVTHTFAQGGTRTVGVTVVDDEGCADTPVFTGQVVTCNGGPKANATTQVTLG